ncbi:hypothetical protein [Mesorhizobium sp. M0130]|uniref:hypothetical protein n=1 Tax=Mesorhizobium sp. M0130 TaxID=2956887 RepID=UPI00333C7002
MIRRLPVTAAEHDPARRMAGLQSSGLCIHMADQVTRNAPIASMGSVLIGAENVE